MNAIDHVSADLAAALVMQVARVLERSVAGEHAAALAACEGVRPLARGRRLLTALERIAAGAMPVIRAGDGLFVAGDVKKDVADHVARTMDTLVAYVGTRRSLVLLRIEGEEPHAQVVQELDGIALVLMCPKEVADQQVLAHELAHTFGLADHRVLDEGWAEWLVACTFEVGGFCEERFRERARGAPAAGSLLADRWRAQPCFESHFHFPEGAVRAASALIVADLVARLGPTGVIRLMLKIRDDGAEDVRPLIAAVGGLRDMSWDALESLAERPDAIAIVEVRRAFTLGLGDAVADRLPRFAAAVAAQPDHRELTTAYLMLLLLAGSDPAAAQVRLTLDRELSRFVRQHGEAPIGYALCLSREGMAIRLAPNFLELNDHFNRGRTIKAAALQQFPTDFDVLVAAAKFEMNTPIEFGGDPAVAGNLVARAAALAPWPDVASQLRRFAKRHPSEVGVQ